MLMLQEYLKHLADLRLYNIHDKDTRVLYVSISKASTPTVKIIDWIRRFNGHWTAFIQSFPVLFRKKNNCQIMQVPGHPVAMQPNMEAVNNQQ